MKLFLLIVLAAVIGYFAYRATRRKHADPVVVSEPGPAAPAADAPEPEEKSGKRPRHKQD